MTDHKKLLKELNVEHDLNLMEIDIQYDILRAKMVAKYGETKVSEFEESIKDGDGIAFCVRKTTM